jgi:hypothetical protein
MKRLLLVLVAVAIAGVSTAEAQKKLSVSGQKRSIACGSGETVQIVGQRNTLTVTGDCRKVDVSGANNIISIEAVGSIEVTGTDNDITWQRAIGGNAPRVSTTGAGNKINRAAAADGADRAPAADRGAAPDRVSAAPVTPHASDPGSPPAAGARSTSPPSTAAPSTAARSRRPLSPTTSSGAAVKILEDDRHDAIDCNGRDISILGSRNVLQLRGICPAVIVSGSDNEIDIDAAQRIETTGDRNRVTWVDVTTGREPRVQNTGTRNRISKADRKPESR